MRKGTKRKAKEVVGKGKAKEAAETATTTQEQTEGTNKNEPGQTQLAPEKNESVQEKQKEESPKKNDKVVVKRQAKRAKIVKPETETEYFPDKRNLVMQAAALFHLFFFSFWLFHFDNVE